MLRRVPLRLAIFKQLRYISLYHSLWFAVQPSGAAPGLFRGDFPLLVALIWSLMIQHVACEINLLGSLVLTRDIFWCFEYES